MNYVYNFFIFVDILSIEMDSQQFNALKTILKNFDRRLSYLEEKQKESDSLRQLASLNKNPTSFYSSYNNSLFINTSTDVSSPTPIIPTSSFDKTAQTPMLNMFSSVLDQENHGNLQILGDSIEELENRLNRKSILDANDPIYCPQVNEDVNSTETTNKKRQYSKTQLLEIKRTTTMDDIEQKGKQGEINQFVKVSSINAT